MARAIRAMGNDSYGWAVETMERKPELVVPSLSRLHDAPSPECRRFPVVAPILAADGRIREAKQNPGRVIDRTHHPRKDHEKARW